MQENTDKSSRTDALRPGNGRSQTGSEHKKTILVVDDEPEIVQSLRSFLEPRGYPVAVAYDGFQGVELYDKVQPTIVLSDIKMPGMDGISLLREVKKRSQGQTEMIMITGHGGLNDAIACLQCGAFRYIQKPIDLRELQSAIRDALAKIVTIKERNLFLERLKQYSEDLEKQVLERTSRLRKVNERLEYLSVTDELTGAYNRRYLFKRLDEEMAQAVRHGFPLAVLLIDIDDFKKINDDYGHEQGDSVIKEFARIIMARIRRGETLARYGGEEFAVILPHTGIESACVFANILRELVENNDFPGLREGRRLIGLVTFCEDITEKKKAEEMIIRLREDLEHKVEERTAQLFELQEELIRKEKMAILGQISGSVGHELRNPLGVINNAVYFLKSALHEADETVREYLEIIKTEVDSSQRIINDLLDFSRTKASQKELIPAGDLIRRSLAKCQIPDNVSIETPCSGTDMPVYADPFQMVQVLQNLIANSVQAMPEGGSLNISARSVSGSGLQLLRSTLKCETLSPEPDSGFVEIAVRDTGQGISPENLKRLFQPLFTTKARGLGLGLIVVKKLTEANGGAIEVETEVGRGTSFTIMLPSGEWHT